jgi:hypothetical protein
MLWSHSHRGIIKANKFFTIGTTIPTSTVVETKPPSTKPRSTVVVWVTYTPPLPTPTINGKPIDQSGGGQGTCKDIVYGTVPNYLDYLYCLANLRTNNWGSMICAGATWYISGQYWNSVEDCFDGCVSCLAKLIEGGNVIQAKCNWAAGPVDVALCGVGFCNGYSC